MYIIICLIVYPVHVRSFTYTSNIHLSYITLFDVGFGDRLVSEIKKGAPKDVKIKVTLIALVVMYQYMPTVYKLALQHLLSESTYG